MLIIDSIEVIILTFCIIKRLSRTLGNLRVDAVSDWLAVALSSTPESTESPREGGKKDHFFILRSDVTS